MSQSYQSHSKKPWPLMIVFSGTFLAMVLAVLLPNSQQYAVLVLLGGMLIYGFTYTRMQLLMMQDRIIRLEMRMRFEKLLPEALLQQVDVLTLPQIIALRFASDAELPELTRQVLDGKLTTPDSIKQAITNWHADDMRV